MTSVRSGADDHRGSPERERLLGLIVDHCLEHGVADLSLRKLAVATGSNNRMLLYYFTSKEELIGTALRAAVDRFPLVSSALDPLHRHDLAFDVRFRRCWRRLTDPGNLPFLRLFFEVFGLANRQPGRFDTYFDRVGHDWAREVSGVLRADGVPAATARSAGRELVALWRGLQFDLLATGERSAIDRAHDAAVAGLADRLKAASRHTQA